MVRDMEVGDTTGTTKKTAQIQEVYPNDNLLAIFAGWIRTICLSLAKMIGISLQGTGLDT